MDNRISEDGTFARPGPQRNPRPTWPCLGPGASGACCIGVARLHRSVGPSQVWEWAVRVAQLGLGTLVPALDLPSGGRRAGRGVVVEVVLVAAMELGLGTGTGVWLVVQAAEVALLARAVPTAVAIRHQTAT